MLFWKVVIGRTYEERVLLASLLLNTCLSSDKLNRPNYNNFACLLVTWLSNQTIPSLAIIYSDSEFLGQAVSYLICLSGATQKAKV